PAIPGASDLFERGFVTYSDSAKIESLGVAPQILERFGAVSAEAARAMAAGAIAHSPAGLALSITGIAGPGGGSLGKPIFAALPLRGGLCIWFDDPSWLLAVQVLDGVGAGLFEALLPL